MRLGSRASYLIWTGVKHQARSQLKSDCCGSNRASRGASPAAAELSAARPRRFQRFEGELTKVLVHPLWPCLNVLDDDCHHLIACHLFRRASLLSSRSRHKALNICEAEYPPPLRCALTLTTKGLTSWQQEICAVYNLCTHWHCQRKQDRSHESLHTFNIAQKRSGEGPYLRIFHKICGGPSARQRRSLFGPRPGTGCPPFDGPMQQHSSEHNIAIISSAKRSKSL